MKKSVICALFALCALLTGASAVQAAQLKVLATGAMTDALKELAKDYSARTGVTVDVEREISGAIAKRMRAGERWDLVLSTDEIVDALTKEHILDKPGQSVLSRTYVGLSVKAGAKVPKISTPDELKAAVLAARGVAYPDPKNGAPSGIYVEEVMKQLGILDAVRAKAVVGRRGADVAVAVAEGKAEIGMTLIAEMLPEKELMVVGRLPQPFQKPIVYAAATVTAAENPKDAQALLKELQSSKGAAAISRIGGIELLGKK